jgi:hypothetical protein
MKLPRYELTAEKSLMVFEFVSEGHNGKIPKLIKFSETSLKGIYNLAFGDKNIVTEEINDTVVSNNGDSEKVLSTVVAAVYAFTDHYPGIWVYATGSTKARTRLYRMGITKYYGVVKHDFVVFGFRDGEWEDFEKDPEKYIDQAFDKRNHSIAEKVKVYPK